MSNAIGQMLHWAIKHNWISAGQLIGGKISFPILLAAPKIFSQANIYELM